MSDIFSKYAERYSAKSFNKINFTNQTKQKTSDENILYTNADIYSDKIYETSYKIDGNMAYMCPNCYSVEHIKTQVSNNAKLVYDHLTDDEIDDVESSKVRLSVSYDVKAKCPVCKYYKSLIRLDDNIADTIGILNIKGYLTSSSSEGYNSPTDGVVDPYIGFNTLSMHYKGRTLSKIENFIESTLPLSWYIDRPSYMCSYVTVDDRTRLNLEVKRFIPFYMINHFVIKSDYWNKDEALRDILKWARSLPDLKEGGII